ncbi:MAG: hypothetical protein ACPL06_01850 [Candidatus Anstonellales archaeon]
MKRIFFVLLFCAISLAYMPGVQLYISFNGSEPVVDSVIVGYVYAYEPTSTSGEYKLSIFFENKTIYETYFDEQKTVLYYDGENFGGAEMVDVPFTPIVPFVHHSEVVEISKKDNILFSKSLSEYVCRENMECESMENFLSCPSDCHSGGKDDFCDRIEDGICDPDCISSADLDCERKNDTVMDFYDALKKQNITIEEGPMYSDDPMPITYECLCLFALFVLISVLVIFFVVWYFYKKLKVKK